MRLQWLAIGITLIVTFSTFGYPLLFDRLFIGLLVVTALVSLKWDKNLFTLCVIFMGALLIEEAAWYFSEGNRYFIIPAYLYLLYACWINEYSKLGKLSFVLAIVAISAEVYWLYINKVGPRIFWYAFICANVLVARHLVLLRPHICGMKFDKYYDDWKITKSDIDVSYIVTARLILEFLNIIEYLARHLLGAQVMIIYQNYPFAAQVISVITFYLFFRALFETIKIKILPA